MSTPTLTCDDATSTSITLRMCGGYWKTHGPVGCQTGNNTNVWPQSVQDNDLTLGGCTYTQDQLCSIFNAQGTAGKWLVRAGSPVDRGRAKYRRMAHVLRKR